MQASLFEAKFTTYLLLSLKNCSKLRHSLTANPSYPSLLHRTTNHHAHEIQFHWNLKKVANLLANPSDFPCNGRRNKAQVLCSRYVSLPQWQWAACRTPWRLYGNRYFLRASNATKGSMSCIRWDGMPLAYLLNSMPSKPVHTRALQRNKKKKKKKRAEL